MLIGRRGDNKKENESCHSFTGQTYLTSLYFYQLSSKYIWRHRNLGAHKVVCTDKRTGGRKTNGQRISIVSFYKRPGATMNCCIKKQKKYASSPGFSNYTMI